MLGHYKTPAVIALATLFAFSTLLFINPRPAKSAATHLVISEVQIGKSGTGNADNDFVEIYNPTNSPLDLNGHRLVKRTAGDTMDDAIKSWTTETIVAPHSYYLWATGGWDPGVTADATTSATLAADNGVALRQGLADTGTIIDSVGWDQAANAFVENTAFPQDPPFDSSIERKACVASTGETMLGSEATSGNAQDSDNNANDFILRSLSQPQNSQSTAEIPNCADITPTPTATATATASASPTASPNETAIPSPSPTSSPEVTATPTASPTPTESPSPTASPTATPTDTPTATPTIEASPTLSPTPTVIPTKSPRPHFPWHRQFSCTVVYKTFHFGWMSMTLPMIFCGFF